MYFILLFVLYIVQPRIIEAYSETQQLEILRTCRECTVREERNTSINPKCVECFCDLNCITFGDCCIDILIDKDLHTKPIDHGLTCIDTSRTAFLKIKHPSKSITNIRDTRSAQNVARTNESGLVLTELEDESYFWNMVEDIDGFDSIEDIWGYYMKTHYRLKDNNKKLCSKEIVPVSCSNGVTYINMGCALSNMATGCVHWNIESDCEDIYCEFYLISPPFAELRLCDTRRSRMIISTCQLKYSYLDDLCSKYYSLVADNFGTVYRNLFCFECNGGEKLTHVERSINPFTSLTQFTDGFTQMITECSGITSWFDSDANKCRPIKCHGDKILKDSDCVDNNRTALGNKYHMVVHLRLITPDPVPNLNQIIGHVMFRILDNLGTASYNIETSAQIRNLINSEVFVHLWFEVTEKNFRSFDVELNLSRPTNTYYFLGFQVYAEKRLRLLNQSENIYIKYLKSDRITGLCCNVNDGLDISDKFEFVAVTNQLTCSYIEFDQSEFSLGKRYAFIERFNLSLYTMQYSVLQNKLSVCFELFMSMTKLVPTNATYYISNDSGTFDVTLWYVTIACITLSIFSLFIIIVTYSVVKEMRTQPGINNLILSLNLLLAQLILMIGFDKISYLTLCKALGMITHFFWLSTLFYMNVCSYHMFKVFVLGRFLISASHATVKQSLIYAIYVYGSAIIVIGITVTVNAIVSGGELLGYGGAICYLSNTLLVLYSFVIPLCFVIVSNVIFFIWTIMTIHRVKQEGKQTGERNNVYIYLKLSVVTGVFWTVSLLSNFFDTIILEYISVILNGSQGVFLLWSLIINKKVLRKYKALFCKCSFNDQSEMSRSKK